jgi:hypothetical protein
MAGELGTQGRDFLGKQQQKSIKTSDFHCWSFSDFRIETSPLLGCTGNHEIRSFPVLSFFAIE